MTAVRYATPLREGGSLPGLVEADDLGTYVVKFTGAGQGPRTLVAEVVVGELARRLGLRVPELVRIEVDPVIGRGEPDQEVQALLKASGGGNLGMDFLPGALGFDPLAFGVGAEEAGRVLWLDALTCNVDRSWRNPNLLVFHGDLWLIDHGAALIWHHNWPGARRAALRPYDASDHVLLRFCPDVAGADEALAPLVTRELLREVVAAVPGEWLADTPGFTGPEAVREAYVDVLAARLAGRDAWLPAVIEAVPPPDEAARLQRERRDGGDNRPEWVARRLGPKRGGR